VQPDCHSLAIRQKKATMTVSRHWCLTLLTGIFLAAGCSIGMERPGQEPDFDEAVFRTVVQELGSRERLELRVDPRPLLRDTAPVPDLTRLVFHADSVAVAMRRRVLAELAYHPVDVTGREYCRWDTATMIRGQPGTYDPPVICAAVGLVRQEDRSESDASVGPIVRVILIGATQFRVMDMVLQRHGPKDEFRVLETRMLLHRES
jgi:hypothetical protein